LGFPFLHPHVYNSRPTPVSVAEYKKDRHLQHKGLISLSGKKYTIEQK
jgi:hypothetical protein